jgi:cyanophycinase
LIDKSSANDGGIAQSLRQAKLVYLLGGFPHYLGQTLKETLAWQAVLDAYRNGAVIAGSSAGAMVICGYYYDPKTAQIHKGLGLLPNSLVLPHHDTFGKSWAPKLQKLLPAVTLIGIDEQTGMLNDGAQSWTVSGRGAVTLYSDNTRSVIDTGNSFSL